MSIAAAAVKLAPSTTIVDTNPSTIALAPRRWRDTRWVGQVSGQATTPEVLAGAWVSPEARRTVNRAYAAACADLAQATLGGLPLHSAEWDHWFAALRTTARELSPALAGAHVVRRALHHGSRLEGKDAPWAHRLRRGFAALLAASLPEPVPALIGEDLATFRANDAAWLAQHPLVPLDETSAPASCRVLPVELAPPQLQADAGSETVRWPTATLRPNPLNPRGSLDPTGIEELAASIVAHADQGGILQPLLVTPDGTVVAGHRRLAAARRVGLAEVPVLVRALTPAHQLELLLVENLQRQELSPLAEARGYQRLIAEGYTQAAIARAVGITSSRVASRLDLLQLDPRVQARFDGIELPISLAPVLLRVRNPVQQRRLAGLAARRGLSVAQVARAVDQALGAPGCHRLPLSPSVSVLPPEASPPDVRPSPDRQAALTALQAQAERVVTFGRLATVLAGVCTECGMTELPTICAECPGLALVTALLAPTGPSARSVRGRAGIRP